MDLELKGRKAIITGASKGIGFATAKLLADEGMDVAICARGEEALLKTRAELSGRGVRAYAMAIDLNDATAIDSFVEQTATELGRVDVLVNNVGGTARGETEDDVWQGTFDLNVRAAMRASRAALPHMLALPTQSSTRRTSTPAFARSTIASISMSAASPGRKM